MNYQVVSKSSNSFGDLVVIVQGLEKQGPTLVSTYKTLTFGEGDWPDALQLTNEIRRAFGQIVGE